MNETCCSLCSVRASSPALSPTLSWLLSSRASSSAATSTRSTPASSLGELLSLLQILHGGQHLHESPPSALLLPSLRLHEGLRRLHHHHRPLHSPLRSHLLHPQQVSPSSYPSTLFILSNIVIRIFQGMGMAFTFQTSNSLYF